ncbi:MAG: hypothetical protein QOJ64_843 [Acidobacteriota bacterium]|nr:hypothetical protein [Acidobacteriota bacterium]
MWGAGRYGLRPFVLPLWIESPKSKVDSQIDCALSAIPAYRLLS